MKIRYIRTFEVEVDDDTLVKCCRIRSVDYGFDQAGIQDIGYELDSQGLLQDDGNEVELVEIINVDDFEHDFYHHDELADELSRNKAGKS